MSNWRMKAICGIVHFLVATLLLFLLFFLCLSGGEHSSADLLGVATFTSFLMTGAFLFGINVGEDLS